MARDHRDNVQPLADLPARRGTHLVRGPAQVASAHRTRVLDAHSCTGVVVEGVASLGTSCATPLARPPGSPAGARRAAAAAPVATRARVGRALSLRHHVRAGTI